METRNLILKKNLDQIKRKKQVHREIEQQQKLRGVKNRTATLEKFGKAIVARKTQGKQARAHGGCLWLSEAMKDATSCEKPR